MLGLRFLDGSPRDLDRADLIAQGEERNLHLLCIDTQLIDRRRTVDIAGNEDRCAARRLELPRQLRRGCRLTGTLETHHHDDGNLARRTKGDLGRLRTHHLGELVIDDLDNRLRRCEAVQHLLTDGLFLHLRDEILHQLEVDVGLEQCHTHLAERLVDIVLGKLPLPTQI